MEYKWCGDFFYIYCIYGKVNIGVQVVNFEEGIFSCWVYYLFVVIVVLLVFIVKLFYGQREVNGVVYYQVVDIVQVVFGEFKVGICNIGFDKNVVYLYGVVLVFQYLNDVEIKFRFDYWRDFVFFQMEGSGFKFRYIMFLFCLVQVVFGMGRIIVRVFFGQFGKVFVFFYNLFVQFFQQVDCLFLFFFIDFRFVYDFVDFYFRIKIGEVVLWNGIEKGFDF